MTPAQFPIAHGLVADARRALWLAPERTLVVADVHLGYAWAHRHLGNLLPLSAGEDALDRLVALQQDYQPRELVVLGDMVHRAVAIPAIHGEVRRLVEHLSAHCSLTFVLGNHDRHLEKLLTGLESSVRLVEQLRLGAHLLLHGDRLAEAPVAGWTFIGHEHPAIGLDDGVASQVKCPCFLVGPRVIILPAFSRWAAGSPVGRGEFISPVAREASFTQALAVVGERLLPIPLTGAGTG